MAEENIQNLGFNADDYFVAVDKIVQHNTNWQKSLQTIIDQLNKSTEGVSRQIVRIRERDSEGNKLFATLKREGNEWKLLSQSVTINSEAIKRNADISVSSVERVREAQKRLGADFNKLAEKQSKIITRDIGGSREDVTRAGKTIPSPQNVSVASSRADLQEAQRKNDQEFALNQAARDRENKARIDSINKIINDQQTLQNNSLKLQKKYTDLLEREEKRKRKIIEKEQTELNRTQERLLNRYQEILQSQQRRQQALQLQTQLQRQFITPSIASHEEVARVTAAIGKISSAVQSGAITSARAMQIIQATQTGSTEVFRGAEARIASLGHGIKKASAGLGDSFKAESAKAVAANERLARSLEQVGESGARNAQRLTLSWQSMVRIFLVQSLHTVIGRFIAALREGIQSAQEFQIRISEIRTISQEKQLSFDKWTNSVRALSDQFGNPILDVAKGTYEAISNQIVKGADAASFMAKALRFAQITVSSTADSVNILSSVINSYRLNIEDADRISAILFKTIDLGRVTASEMANTFGRVTGLAAPLGVSIEEVAASITTLTIQGIKYNEAFTLINNVLVELIKPTKEMNKLLAANGFATGQAAIAALGFKGVLQLVEQATAGSAEEMGELFNNMRGLRGILGLTGSAFNRFEIDLAKITNASKEFTNAQATVLESAGKQFQLEINRIKNTFIEQGSVFIKFIDDLTRTTDDTGKRVSGFSDTINNLTRVIALAVEGFLAYKVVQVIAAIHTRGLTSAIYYQQLALNAQAGGLTNVTAAAFRYQGILASLTKISPTFLATAGLTGVLALWQELRVRAEEARRSYEELDSRIAALVEKQTANYRRELDQQQAILKKHLNERNQQYLQHVANVNKLTDAIGKIQAERQKATNDALEKIFDSHIKNLQDRIREFEAEAKKAASTIEETQRKIFELQEGIARSTFDKKINLLPPEQQVDAMVKKIKELQYTNTQTINQPFKSASDEQTAIDQHLRRQQEIERILNGILERRNDAVRERKELTDQIKEAEDAIAAKGGIREDAAELQKIRDLEKEINAASGKRKTDLQREIAERKRLATETLHGSRDTEQDRKDQLHLDKLKAKLTVQDSILGSLSKIGEIHSLDLLFDEQKIKNLEQIIPLSEKIRADATKAAEIENQRVLILKDTLKELVKFELPEIKSPEQGIQELEKFKKIFDSVARDLPLDQYAAVLKKQQDLELSVNRQTDKLILEANNDALQKEKTAAEKQIEEVANARKKAEDKRVANKALLTQLGNEIEAFARAKLGSDLIIGSYVKAYKEAVEAFNQKITPESTQALIDAQNDLIARAADQGKSLGRQLKSIFTPTLGIEPGAISESTGAAADFKQILIGTEDTIETVANRLSKAIFELQQAPKEEAKLNTKLDEARKRINDVAIALAESMAPLSDESKALIKSSQTYRESLEAGTQDIWDMSAAIIDASKRLNLLTPASVVTPVPRAKGGIIDWTPRGSDRVPALLTPGEFVVNAKSTEKHFHKLVEINNNQVPSNPISNNRLIEKLTESLEHQKDTGVFFQLRNLAKIIERLAKMYAMPDEYKRRAVLYFSGGGFVPKGSDTIPAMLTPGEFVVNAKSTRRYYDQLMKINKGIDPYYLAEGGFIGEFTPVVTGSRNLNLKSVKNNSNIKFGDINVNVHSNGNTKIDARSLANDIQREIRLKTVNWKN